ncbi:MAG: aldo/keto reductase [Myxococcales bacterium]
MDLKPFGNTAAHVPALGQGTWQLEQADRRHALAALRRGVELGLTHVDTAEMYGSGAVEELVGEALDGLRDQVFLATKVLPQNASYEGTLAACERSLRRLRTDRVDLYLLHWPGAHPLEETFRAFAELRRSGKALHTGLSNFDEDGLRDALALAGPGAIACDQVLHHLRERHVEATLQPLCANEGVAMVAYSPFGSGDFPGPASAGGKVLAEVARAHGATPRQIALAFLTRAPGSFAIPKASTRGHVEENAGAARVALSRSDVARIDAVFPVRERSSLPML